MKEIWYKKAVKALVIKMKPLMKLFLRIFFNVRFLQGRHFDNELSGYFWGVRSVWTNNILRLAKPQPFPVSHRMKISNASNLEFHIDDLHNFQSPGVYLQNYYGTIKLGRGCYIGPNVGIITANHDPKDLDKHVASKNVVIGENCWIGMNSVILPGVILGPRTIVGAGAIVTRSFPDGNCVVAGNPAYIIKKL